MLIPIIIISVYALAALATIAGIIYLVIRKQKIRKTERFEKRSN